MAKEVKIEDVLGKQWASNLFIGVELRDDGKLVWKAKCLYCGGIKKSTNLPGLKYERTCKLCYKKHLEEIRQEDLEYERQRKLSQK